MHNSRLTLDTRNTRRCQIEDVESGLYEFRLVVGRMFRELFNAQNHTRTHHCGGLSVISFIQGLEIRLEVAICHAVPKLDRTCIVRCLTRILLPGRNHSTAQRTIENR